MIKKEQLKECKSNLKKIKWNKIKCYGQNWQKKKNKSRKGLKNNNQKNECHI